MSSHDLDGIRHALGIASERGYAEVSIRSGDLRFSAVLEPRSKKRSSQAPSVAQEDEADQSAALHEIVAPLVGYFRPADPPLEVGATVEPGAVVGVVASLGDIPYAVESSFSGEVVEVLVASGDAVEYGQPIARVKP
jgi:acetyl-CoA carboxylase biotin carboxyl carrier protein